MKPFIRYMGSKWRLAHLYGEPTEDVLVEVFGGGVGFGTRHSHKKVIIVEMLKELADLWKWLIKAHPDDVRNMPVGISSMDEVPQGPQRTLVGFWMGRGDSRPRKKLTDKNLEDLRKSDVGHFWGPSVRERIACQVSQIRNWEVIQGDYRNAPNIRAHWHIDPPYQFQGGGYVHNNKQLDYAELADFCLSRIGPGEVCEGEGAKWLNFVPLASIQSQNTNAYKKEFVYRLRDLPEFARAVL